MVREHIVKFAGENNNFYNRCEDYFAHRISTETGKQTAVAFDASHSLIAKQNEIQQEFFAEIDRVSGISREGLRPEAYAANPQVVWATMAIINNVVDTVLPMIVTDTLAPFIDMRTVGAGDICKFEIKPNSFLTVTDTAHGNLETVRQRKFMKEIQVVPTEHTVTTFTKYFDVVHGKEPVCDVAMQIAASFVRAMNEDAFVTFNTHVAAASGHRMMNFGVTSAKDMVKISAAVAQLNGGAPAVMMGDTAGLMSLPSVTGIPNNWRGNYDAAAQRFGFVQDFFGIQTYTVPFYLKSGAEDIANAASPVIGNIIGGLGDNVVYMMSPAAAKPVVGVMASGLQNTTDFLSNADLTSGMTMRREWAFACLDTGWMAKIQTVE